MLVIAANCKAQTSEPAASVDVRDVCLASHEKSQELRLSGRLLESKKELLGCAEEQCPSAVRVDCLRWLDEVEAATPTIVLVAESDRGDEMDVRVTIDGRLVTTQLDGKSIELDPGSHQLVFDPKAAKPLEMRIVLGQGEKNRIIRLDFRTKSSLVPGAMPVSTGSALPPPVGTRPVPTFTYVLGGVAVASAISATIFGISALSARKSAEDSCAPLCPESTVKDVKQKALLSDLSAGFAVLSAGAATLLYFTRPTVYIKSSQARSDGIFEHWRLGVSSTSAFTSWGGTFQ